MATKGKADGKAGKAKAGKAKVGETKAGEAKAGPEIGKSYIPGQTFGLKPVTYSIIEGRAVFEGDIVLGTAQELEHVRQQVESAPEEVASAVAITGAQFRWPNGIVNFRIDPALTNQQRVRDAIQHWEQRTVIRFRERTVEPNFVTFTNGVGCSSNVGMRGGEQFVWLGNECSTGNVIHEIGHTVGLWHEQSREDRDVHVRINFPNIDPATIHNFDQHITDGDDIGAYDYGSIMHYPRNAFAVNPAVDTITPIPDATVQIGQRTALSAGDISAVNSMYRQKATLGDTSNNGPALTTRTNQVLLSWTGTGNLRLNFMTSSNGLAFGNKVTLGEVSPNSPAVASFNNKYFVAWTGVGNNQLNVLQSNNGMSWTNKVTMGDTSLSRPALAAFNGKLYLAWRGVGNNQLNVISSADGIHWSNKVTLGDTTTSGPALATFGNQLLLAWRGVGNNQLNVIRSTNGTAFTGKITLGDTTTSGPALATIGNHAVLSWQGVGNRQLNLLTSTDGTHWAGKFTSQETCIDGPAITALGTNLVWGWSGTDAAHHLNTMLFGI